MKRSRTALALFLGAFGSLISAVELTGPVGLAASEANAVARLAIRTPSPTRCEFLDSLEYCEYGYDAAPRSKTIAASECSSDPSDGVPECVDYQDAPESSEAAGKLEIESAITQQQYGCFECWDAAGCENAMPATTDSVMCPLGILAPQRTARVEADRSWEV
ncbi:MAG TPA: hypothetical protein VG713_13050, partial [Pirellulales bacterium]|nr:hypothetical protein [Pirellulales bacterium]